MSKKIEDKYRKLTETEHVLQRPSMYIGSTSLNTSNKYIIEKEYGETKGKPLLKIRLNGFKNNE
jgi:hypothetical protein